MTSSQQAIFTSLISGYRALHQYVAFHHGQCIGSDDHAARIAKVLGCWIVSHPPTNRKAVSDFPADEYRAPKPYLHRNRDIVDETSILIATPGELEERLRSGTWATIRYARSKGYEPTIIYPLPHELDAVLDVPFLQQEQEQDTMQRLGSL
jgi:hypothetical protein